MEATQCPAQEHGEDHLHDERVTSVAFEVEGECDGRRLNMWLSRLLQEKGADLFRSKGILCIHCSPEKCAPPRALPPHACACCALDREGMQRS